MQGNKYAREAFTLMAASEPLHHSWRPTHQGSGDWGLPEESTLVHPEDIALRNDLRALDATSPDFWDFGDTAERTFAHGYFQYPAMMVPQMVGQALDSVGARRSGQIRLLDPFAGAGTVVTEAIARGWDVTAVDLNPLAALLCQAKAGPFHPKVMADAVARVLAVVSRAGMDAHHWFPNVRKWFEPTVIEGLSRLRQAISTEPLRYVRRFLWVVMAETVRLTSNSRLSSVKLHVKLPKDRVATDPVVVFARIADRNLVLLKAETEALRLAGRLRHDGWPSSRTTVILGDATDLVAVGIEERPNVLLTSPPYGDNRSTIAYGQHAYLPLQWIDLCDAGATDRGSVVRPSTIDSMSLGGMRKGGIERAAELSAISGTTRVVLDRLAAIRRDHATKVGAFLGDLNLTFGNALRAIEDGAHVVVTVGDRTVSGTRVPTARIVQDMVTSRGGVLIAAISRRLPRSRRMASRNTFAPNIATEWMLVMRLR